MAKAKTVADVMTANPVMLRADSPLTEAAKAMRDSDIGDVLVMDDGTIRGILTDRDIVVRAIAPGKDPSTTPIKDICSRDLTTVSSATGVNDAVTMMRDHAIRRLPVVEGDRPVGIVSIGDLAVARDPRSALADISGSPPNT